MQCERCGAHAETIRNGRAICHLCAAEVATIKLVVVWCATLIAAVAVFLFY